MLHSVVRMVLPRQCGLCDQLTDADFGLCPDCWATTDFVTGLVCDHCGVPLMGEDETALCDECLMEPRPWATGRTVFGYSGGGRKLVLSLKHGDRQDLVPMLSAMLSRAARPLLSDDTVIVPVPLHWTRMFRRRFNQSALLAAETGRILGRPVVVDGLAKVHRTRPTEGMSREARLAVQQGSIRPHPKNGCRMRGRSVLIIDDVMTTGATLAAATEGARLAGAKQVCVLTLARAYKET